MKQGFAVIDVNLPKHVTAVDHDQEHEEVDRVDYRTKEATELLTYLWDNYIDLNDATHVFLMGTNTGHGAIVNFIKANESRAQDAMTKAISFVEDVPLQSCKSATSDTLDSWYYASSLVFVANEHAFWSSEYARKIKKRFGRIYKSTAESISEMLSTHKQTVIDTLLEETEDWRLNRAASPDEDIASVDTQQQFEPEPAAAGLPPVSNFALPNSTASPNGRGSRTPGIGSPMKGAPPISNFAMSPRQRSSRSPMR